MQVAVTNLWERGCVSNMQAVVALAKCCNLGRDFCVRFEKKLDCSEEAWVYTWAFIPNAKSVGNERYDHQKISGTLYVQKDYPGCPYCGSKTFIVCSCGRLSCGAAEIGSTFTCHWCGNSAKIVAAETVSLTADGDV